MNKIRIHGYGQELLATVLLDDEGSGSAMVDWTGTADTFKFYEDGVLVFEGLVGQHTGQLQRPGDLMLDSRVLVIGVSEVRIEGLDLGELERLRKLDEMGFIAHRAFPEEVCDECYGTGFYKGLGRACEVCG